MKLYFGPHGELNYSYTWNRGPYAVGVRSQGCFYHGTWNEGDFTWYGQGATLEEALWDAWSNGYPFGHRPPWDGHRNPKEGVN